MLFTPEKSPREYPRAVPVSLPFLDGGRTWWAHFEFARINIELTILPKEIEDLREARASTWIAG